MAIPIKYNIGSLFARRVSLLMTVVGIGVVIAVMLSMLGLYNGVRTAITSSGSPENLMVLREGALTEATSWVQRDAFRVIRSLNGIEKDARGEPIASPELVMIFKLPKKDDPKGSNINVRGVTPAAFALRPYVKMTGGRMFNPGVGEVIVSERVQKRFANLETGKSFRFGPRDWTVVGTFDADGTSFDSEMWTDVDFLGLAQKREAYSTVVLRPVDTQAFETLGNTIKTDNRLKLAVKSEYQYYADQTQGLLGIVILVGFVTVFMIVGAALGAANTMFSAVASRKRELATMRALGFKRRAVLMSVLIESAFVSLLGGLAGIVLSLPVNGISTGTTNFQTFSEVAFNFRISPQVAAFGLALALVSGVIGGLVPAISAARLPIIRSLRDM